MYSPNPDAAPVTEPKYEVIGGYRVHPLASKFPLIKGTDFNVLVASIKKSGKVEPVKTHEGLLIDGRNRLRAVEMLREQGIDIEVPEEEWRSNNGETVEEYIFALNLHRRHLDPDQRAMLAAMSMDSFRSQAAKRQENSRFKGKSAAAAKSTPPTSSGKKRRTSREKDEASTVGQIAKKGEVTLYKARQAANVQKAVDAGEVENEECLKIINGDQKLKDVKVPSKTKSLPKKKAKKRDKDSPKAATMHEAAETMPDHDTAVTLEAIEKQWQRFLSQYAKKDHREVRRLLMGILTGECEQDIL